MDEILSIRKNEEGKYFKQVIQDVELEDHEVEEQKENLKVLFEEIAGLENKLQEKHKEYEKYDDDFRDEVLKSMNVPEEEVEEEQEEKEEPRHY